MKDQVGRLAQQFGIVLGYCSQRRLDTFFADFLRHPADAAIKQAGGVTALGTFGVTLRNQRIEFGEETKWRLHGVAKAAGRAQMASRSMRFGLHQQSVGIAVDADTPQYKDVAGAFAASEAKRREWQDYRNSPPVPGQQIGAPMPGVGAPGAPSYR